MTSYYKKYRSVHYTKADGRHGFKYRLEQPIYYYSERYGKEVRVPRGYLSDGATGAIDIDSLSWWVHDKLCDTGTWDDGTPVTNWQASHVLSDILKSEGRWVRSKYWFWSTWLFGCDKARNNGMW